MAAWCDRHVLWRFHGLASRIRTTWRGVMISIIPTAATALMFFLPAVATDYKATPTTVTLVNGSLGWALSGLGAFAAGLCCARWNRRLVFVVAVSLTALAEFLILVMPMQPTYYAAGVLFYGLATAATLTAWSAVVFDLASKSSRSETTRWGTWGSLFLGHIYTGADVKSRNALAAVARRTLRKPAANVERQHAARLAAAPVWIRENGSYAGFTDSFRR